MVVANESILPPEESEYLSGEKCINKGTTSGLTPDNSISKGTYSKYNPQTVNLIIG